MRSRVSSLLFLGLFVACHDSSGSTAFLPPGTTDLGFAADALTLEDGILAAREFEAGRDLTGDGDGGDTVLHVLDLVSGRSTLVANIENFSNGGGFVACTVSEERQGRDLNGDGDLLDAVLHVVDGRSRTVRNLGLAADRSVAPVQSGRWMAFGVPESDQGGIDIDGDGTASSEIAHVHDALRRTTTSLDVPISFQNDALEMRGSWIVVDGWEDHVVDLNGDGDEDDEVVLTHDLVTGTTENLGHAVSGILAFDGHVLVVQSDEFEQSGDLNGDGDQSDFLVELVALESGARHILAVDAVFARAGGGLAFLELDEHAGTVVYDALTDTFTELTNTPLRYPPRLADRRAAYLVGEAGAGDLNGDGDASDGLLFVFDARTGTATNTGVAILGAFDGLADAFDIDGLRAAYLYSAYNDNQIGDFPDTVAKVRDLATGEVRELAPADGIALVDGLVVLLVPEDRLGRDVDGDGDGDGMDEVLQIYDPIAGRTFDTGLAVPFDVLSASDLAPRFALEGRQLVLSLPEILTNRDRNGDGDTADSVAIAVRLP